MAEAATRLDVKPQSRTAVTSRSPRRWEPFDSMRREMERLIEGFGEGMWRRPFGRPAADLDLWPPRMAWDVTPAVDVSETDTSYESPPRCRE